VGEVFESFLVVASRPTTTVEPTMLIEKLGEELLGSSLGGSVGGLPHFLAVALEPNPVRGIAPIDCRHVSPSAGHPETRTKSDFCKQKNCLGDCQRVESGQVGRGHIMDFLEKR
jgi:hypothetical protein